MALAPIGLTLAQDVEDEDPALLREAVAAIGDEALEGWAYTLTEIEDGQETVSRFDPSLPEGERWSLISIDGRSPTEEERQDVARRGQSSRGFFGSSSNDDHADEQDFQEAGFSSRFGGGGVTLIEETPELAVYRLVSEGEDADFPLEVTFTVIKDGVYLSSMEMRNREPFSPMVGLKIDEMEMVSTFEPVVEGGPALPQSITVNMAGKFLLLRKIGTESRTVYSEYEYVGE